MLLTTFFSFYAQAACTTPAGIAGEMYYNTTSDAMEYCDDTSWIDNGVTVASPTTSILVGHWNIYETTGSTITDSCQHRE